MSNYYNTSLRNLTYRLRKFQAELPKYLEKSVMAKEDVIVSAIADNQLFRRGINGRGVKIKNYRPYTPSTIAQKIRKHQPHTRVTLRDTGAFYAGMHIVYEQDGFYVTSSDLKTEGLVKKYGPEIFRLTDKNLTRILRVHIRQELIRHMKQAARVARFKARYEAEQAKFERYRQRLARKNRR